MPEIMPEIMPESLIQHEHGASPSAGASVEDIQVQSSEHIASSSAARADVEKALSKSLLEYFRALLQLDPSLAQRDIGISDARQAAETSFKTIPHPLLSKYFRTLETAGMVEVYEMINLLSQMIDAHPQLLMEMSPASQRTFLHVAVIANSEVQVQKVLDMILADTDNTSSNDRNDPLSKKMKYLFAVERTSGFIAYQMAYIVGNYQILRMIGRCEEFLTCMGRSIPTLSAGSHVKKNKTSQQLSDREARECQVHVEEIGKVLKSCLEALHFSELPLRCMSLGDEFRLHTSLTWKDKETMCSWIEYHHWNDVVKLLRGIVSKLAEKSLLLTFLELRDSTGKTILHYLADFVDDKPTLWEDDKLTLWEGNQEVNLSNLIFTTLMEELSKHARELDMNVRDNIGRTPLHLAAAQGFTKRVELFANDARTDLNLTFDMPTCEVDGEGNTVKDVEGISPLFLAVTHNHVEVVKALLSIPSSRETGPLDVQLRTRKVIRLSGGVFKASLYYIWTPLQLAAFEGHVETLEVLLADNRIYDSFSGLKSSMLIQFETAPALHLAALGGKPHAVNALLKNKKIDPFALDSDGNTALHYALWSFNYEDVYGLWKFVNMTQPFKFPWNTPMSVDSKNYGEIIGCIDLLLQAGLDIYQPNKLGKIPHFLSQTPPDVRQWWYNKVTSELQVTKTNLSAATNAVSVTAALVAATSFVGPLQPPLGLSTNTDSDNMWLLGYSQVNHAAVDIFIFFDSLSFYLAIASIMLALIPSLPIQHEGVFLGVKKAQRYLQGAVVLLFASITSLICTFGAASVVIIPEGRWKYKAMIVSTTIFGGFICFVVLFLFLKRLWGLISPKRQYPHPTVKPRNRE